MKFLLDQDVYALTAGFLRELGHDVIAAAAAGLSRAADTVLLARAGQEGRILVTRDRDFGGLEFKLQLVPTRQAQARKPTNRADSAVRAPFAAFSAACVRSVRGLRLACRETAVHQR